MYIHVQHITDRHKKLLTLCILCLGWLCGIVLERQTCDVNVVGLILIFCSTAGYNC